MHIPRLRSTLAITALLLSFSGAALAQSVKDLYSVEWPFYVTPTQGIDGQLYATESAQNYGAYGEAFRLTTTGVFTLLNSFDGFGGEVPYSGVTLGTDGYYYGTTLYGGASYYGVLYRMEANGTYTLLHSFAGGADGMRPYAPPIEASDGNFYGTTFGDATTGSTIYQYNPSTGTYASLIQLQESDGASVYAPLLQGFDGNLYGVASAGGTSNVGTVFKLTTAGVLLAVYNIYSYPYENEVPIGPLIQASDGNFYGTTAPGDIPCGSVYRMGPEGAFTTIYKFESYGYETPCNPTAGLVQGSDGYLYGTTSAGGVYGDGAIFRLATSGGEYKTLYSFPYAVGQEPQAALLQHTNGTFYGTTAYGGPKTYGTIFSLSTGASPFITFVRPTGEIGQTAQILGQGLTGVTSVTFNGVPATESHVVSATFMTAVVPSGATTGLVVVTTSTGKLTSNKNFRIN